MPPAPDERAARSPLHGRAAELAELTSGVTPVVLLGGDAGMGKTRLLHEVVQRARGAGDRVLIGHCLDFADSALAYLPFSEILGRLADEEPDTAARLVGEHPALAALTPGRRLMSGTHTAIAEVDRAQLFDNVLAALDGLAADQRLLVVVEDLHWADRSTRDLLSFLFTRSFRNDVTVLGSYRTDDLHRRHPLRPELARWARLPAVRRVQLEPLPDADIRALVRTLHPGVLPERDVTAIAARAEGNAFFAEELVAAVGSAGPTGLPDDLADLLLVRLDGLDDGARAVVRAAACAGRHVSHPLLAAVVGLPEDDLEVALRAAVESHVLVIAADGGYAFRHALLAEAVYDDLLPGERVRLHAAYVAALTGGTVDGTAAELATHARAAHDPTTAIQAGLRAGEEALAVGGPDDAARHFEGVLDLLGRPGVVPPDGVGLAAVVARTCEAVIATGHAGRAMRLVRAQLDAAPADLEPRDRARMLLAWISAALLHENTEEPAVASTEALALIGEEPSRLRTRALSLHARALLMAQRTEEAAKFAGEALAMAQRFGLTEVVSEVELTLAAIEDRLGDQEAAIGALRRVLTAAQEQGDRAAEMRGRYHLALVHLERGDLRRAEELFGTTAAAAVAAGRPWAPYGFDARYHQAMTAYLRGRWDEAVAVADVSGEAPPGDHEAVLTSIRMLVAAGRGDRSVLPLYETLKPSWEREGLVATNSGAAALELYGAAGDVAAVRRVLDEVVTVVGASWSPLFQARLRLHALALGHLGDAARSAPQAERIRLLDGVAELVDVVEAVRLKALTRPRGLGPEGGAWSARADAEHLRLRWLTGVEPPEEEELTDAWVEALRLFDALGHPHERARAAVRLAAVHLAAGRPAAAEPLVQQATAIARRLGATPLLAEIDLLGTRTNPVRTPTRSGAELTAREQEILALVAEGRTNGEIARQLFISTKTVSVHVSNILAKLDASGRTEAVAIARRRSLLPA